MTAPLALQLYTLREDLAGDFVGTVRRVAEIGYVGVEPFGTPDNLLEAAALFKELDLAVPSAHVPLPLGGDQAKVLKIAEAYGLKRMVAMFGPDRFKTLDDVKQACDQFNEAGRVAAENGMTLGYHNHWWEFQPVERQYPYQVMLERLDPAIFFEIDVYWVQAANLDPVTVVQEIGSRAPLLHIKDGPADDPDAPMVAVGAGAVNIPNIVQAGAGMTEWLIVELDHCATTMQTAVEQSYAYLVQKGLGHGRAG